MWWYPDEEYDDVKAEVEQVVAAVARRRLRGCGSIRRG